MTVELRTRYTLVLVEDAEYSVEFERDTERYTSGSSGITVDVNDTYVVVRSTGARQR
jgi:hypothetical protein